MIVLYCIYCVSVDASWCDSPNFRRAAQDAAVVNTRLQLHTHRTEKKQIKMENGCAEEKKRRIRWYCCFSISPLPLKAVDRLPFVTNVSTYAHKLMRPFWCCNQLFFMPS